MCLHVCVLQVFQQYVQYVREKQGVSQAEEDLVAGLQVGVAAAGDGQTDRRVCWRGTAGNGQTGVAAGDGRADDGRVRWRGAAGNGRANGLMQTTGGRAEERHMDRGTPSCCSGGACPERASASPVPC